MQGEQAILINPADAGARGVADELIVAAAIHDQGARLTSYQILAEVVGARQAPRLAACG